MENSPELIETLANYNSKPLFPESLSTDSTVKDKKNSFSNEDVDKYIHSQLNTPKLISYKGALYCNDSIHNMVKCPRCHQVVITSIFTSHLISCFNSRSVK